MTRARDDLEALRDPALRSTPLEAESTAQSTASGPVETGPEEIRQAAGAPAREERPRAEGERPEADGPQQAGPEQAGSERAEPASSASVEPLSVEPRSRGDESLDRERYERYAMPASDLPAANVQAFRGDAGGVLAIVRRAVQSVTRDPARHRRRLPKSRFDAIRSLPELAMALDYAVGRMQPESAPPAEVTERLDQLYEALRPTLAAAEACFPRGIVPETYGIVRRALVAGDPASAAATITNLILDRWNHVQGRISLTREEVTRVNGTAKWLLSNTRAPERLDSRDIRDRLWSLLRERYEQLRAIAQEVSGDDSRDYAPERLAAD
ncbi:hypothetical protein [Sorangium sp. So ce861]|uniref:hypothetical protein n=1 Tax=Sorangium sp. So ce861 TaxID=3133323 RepID=UPI003F6028BD